MVNSICKLLGIARRTYFHWQNDEKKKYAIDFFNKYTNETEINEFIETGKISKFDMLEKYIEEKNMKVDKYLDYFDNNYKSFLDYNDEIINIYMESFVEYNSKESFFIQFHTNVLKIDDEYIQKKLSFLLKDMIENEIIKILEEIVDMLVTSDFKVLVEKSWYESNKRRDEATIQYIIFNIYKYKKNLPKKEKQKLILDLYTAYDIEYKNSKFYSDNPNKLYKEVERLKNI